MGFHTRSTGRRGVLVTEAARGLHNDDNTNKKKKKKNKRNDNNNNNNNMS